MAAKPIRTLGSTGLPKRSLRETPEVDFRKVRVTRNRYARLIAAEGLVVQVGRGRPKRLLESGGTTPRSVRFSDEIWKLLARRAKAKGLTLHAAGFLDLPVYEDAFSSRSSAVS